MIRHRPFDHAPGKLYEMHDDGHRLSVMREACPTHPCVAGPSSFDGATPEC